MWRTELGKAREHDVILEATVVRAEEKVRVADANAEARIKEAVQRESVATKEKQELLAYVNMLKAQLQRSVSGFLYPLLEALLITVIKIVNWNIDFRNPESNLLMNHKIHYQ